jgi:NADH dehydrogenase FAD-containing subunit
VHSKNRLLDRNKADAAYYAMKFLKKRGAKIILNDRIIKHKDNIYYTKSGTEIKADLAFWCAGIQWDTSFMKQFPDDVFAKNGALIVNSHLQLHQHPHIFVGGDITNIAEEKTGRKAESHAKIIVKNINYLLKNKHLLNYKQGKSPIVMSLGDWHGILDYKTIIPGLFSIGLLKKAIEWWTLHQLR